jgi:hypothetical protein
VEYKKQNKELRNGGNAPAYAKASVGEQSVNPSSLGVRRKGSGLKSPIPNLD